MFRKETQINIVLTLPPFSPFTFNANCHINFYAHMWLVFGLYFSLGKENFHECILVEHLQMCSEVQKYRKIPFLVVYAQ